MIMKKTRIGRVLVIVVFVSILDETLTLTLMLAIVYVSKDI